MISIIFVFYVLMIKICSNIFKKFMFPRQLRMAFKMVCCLHKVVTQSLEVNIFTCWCPSKMKMTLLITYHLLPNLGSFWTTLHKNFSN